MKRMRAKKKTAALLTAVSMFMSFGMTAVLAAASPAASVNTVQYGAGELTGDYVYSGESAEGASEYQWYISDTLLGEYLPMDGETSKTLVLGSETANKFVKFGVTPVGETGTAGEEALSSPVHINAGQMETFERGMPSSVDTTGSAGGTVVVSADPTDGNNQVLKLDRTASDGAMTVFTYKFPETSTNTVVIDADVMASSVISNSVAWDMFYAGQSAQGTSWHAFKVVRVGNNLAIVGSSENWGLTNKFTPDEWHHIKFVIDRNANVILKLYFDGEVVCKNMGFRYEGDFDDFFGYLGGASTGTGYYDNISITDVKDYTGLAAADAEALDLGDTTAVQGDILLPAEGTSNGSIIEWESSDASVVAPDGTVTRPGADGENKTVTLTAHIINGNDYTTKEFEVTVLRELKGDETAPAAEVQSVQYGADGLTGVYNYSSDSGSAEKGTKYAWYISDTLLGEYTAIKEEISKTLTLDGNLAGKYVKFGVTPGDSNGLFGAEAKSDPVKIENEAKDYTGQAKADAEAIDLGDTDNVKADLELPATGIQHSSEIVWTTSDYSLIDADGTVKRPGSADGDKTVILTAYVIKGNDYAERVFNITVKCKTAEEEIPPEANVHTVEYGPLELIGSYEYISGVSALESGTIYTWYVSDTMTGEYEPIEGESARVLAIDSGYDGKYVKFGVTPKDEYGFVGETKVSDPVKVEFGEIDTFDEGSDISQTVDISKCYGGTASIQQDPNNPENFALAMNRTSSENNMSMVKYKFNPYTAENARVLILDADLQAGSDIAGDKIWQTFYIGQSGTEVHVYKLYRNGRTLWARGGDITGDDGIIYQDVAIANTFSKGSWHHVRVVLDMENKKVSKVFFDDQLVQENVPFRNDVENINSIFSFTQDNTQGTTWLDNMQVTAVGYYEGLAAEDADNIDIGETAGIIETINLPSEGTRNGSEIAWTSSDESLVAPDGTVNRPDREEGDKTVILTAHVLNGNDYAEKDFEVTVMRELADDEVVEFDAQELLKFNNMIVDSKADFPEEGRYGAKYMWTSSDESIITSGGAVTPQSEKKDVIFNVLLSKGESSKTVPVTVTIAPTIGVEPIEAVRVNTSSQDAGHTLENINDGDYATYWESLEADSDPYAVFDLGKQKKLNRIFIADQSKSIASVNVKVSSDNETWTDADLSGSMGGSNFAVIDLDEINTRYIRIEFEPVSAGTVRINEIKLMFSGVDESAVSAELEKIKLPSSADSDFTVPAALEDGTEIEWSSSNTSVLLYDGTKFIVTRPSSNITVTVTANAGGVEKHFTVIVKGKGVYAGGGGSSSGGGSGINRVFGGISNGTSTPTPAPTQQPPEQQKGFDDIDGVPWAKDAINKLAEQGIVSGTSETTFEPDRPVTREEFAAMIYRAFGFETAETDKGFDDVPSDTWYCEPVTQLFELGIINGIGDNKFGVGVEISRQDMAVMAAGAAKAAGAELEPGEYNFTDGNDIAGYAQNAVGILTAAGVVTGMDDGTFDPYGKTTRAQAAVVISRLLELM